MIDKPPVTWSADDRSDEVSTHAPPGFHYASPDDFLPAPVGDDKLLAGDVPHYIPGDVHPIKQEFDAAYALVQGKAHDYAEDDNVFSNFEQAAVAAGVTVEQVFLVLIGVKVARLTQLIANTKSANFESIDDTILDLMNYAGLLKAYRSANT
jgi:hypothetical protein